MIEDREREEGGQQWDWPIRGDGEEKEWSRAAGGLA